MPERAGGPDQAVEAGRSGAAVGTRTDGDLPMPIASEAPLAEDLTKALSGPADARCLAQYRRDGTLSWLSRGEVLAQGSAVARGLGDAGLRPGEPVIIVPVQDGEVDTAVIVVGCLLTGCPPLVLPAVDGGLSANPGLLSRVAEITDCRALLSGARDASGLAATEALAEAAGVAASVLGLIDLQSGRARLGQSPRPNRVANCQALQLTSGTTGASRLCVWDASSMRDAMAGVAQATALSASDVLFAWSGLPRVIPGFGCAGSTRALRRSRRRRISHCNRWPTACRTRIFGGCLFRTCARSGTPASV
jgi:hypothetical protein